MLGFAAFLVRLVIVVSCVLAAGYSRADDGSLIESNLQQQLEVIVEIEI